MKPLHGNVKGIEIQVNDCSLCHGGIQKFNIQYWAANINRLSKQIQKTPIGEYKGKAKK
jgi:hypothetical protein